MLQNRVVKTKSSSVSFENTLVHSVPSKNSTALDARYTQCYTPLDLEQKTMVGKYKKIPVFRGGTEYG